MESTGEETHTQEDTSLPLSGDQPIPRTVNKTRKKKANYHAIFDQASDAIFVTDFHGNFIDLNDRLCKLLDYSKHELLQLNIMDVVDKAQLENMPIAFDELIAGRHILSSRRMISKTGIAIEVESNVRKCGDNMLLAIVRDVTEIRKTQRMIQHSEARFRSAFEYSAIGMALVSLTGEWLKVNNELCNMLGYTQQELLARSFQQITHPADLEADLHFLQETLTGARDFYRMEKRYIHKGGEIIWINLNVSLIKDDDARPLCFVSQIENITKRKRSEEAHRKSEANLKVIFDTTDTAYVLADNNFKVISFNKYAADFVLQEIGPAANAGDRLQSYFPHDRSAFLGSALPEVLSGLHVNHEMDYPQPDGSVHWYDVRLYPIPGHDKEVFGLMLAIDNITSRKQAELQREKIAGHLMSRNKDLEEFAFILSHNVRSDVARLMGLTNMLTDYEMTEQEKKEIITGISQSANGLDEVVKLLNNMLQLKNEITAIG